MNLQQRNDLNFLGASFLYITAGVGAMITIVPLSWYCLGFLLGLLALVLGSIFLLQAGHQYVKLAASTEAYSFEDLALIIIGAKFQIFTNMIMIGCQGVLIVAALYVAASSLSGLFAELTNQLNATWFSSKMCTFYIYILLTPIFFKKEVKQLKLTGVIQIIFALLLLLFLLLFLIQNYTYIRHQNPSHQFNFPISPTKGTSKIIPKFLVIFMAPCFASVCLPVLKSMGSRSIPLGFRPMLVASLSLVIYYTMITILSIIVFGNILLSYDTVIKAIYHSSHSFLASLLQLIAICITVLHTPVLIFIMRESILLLCYQCCKSTHRRYLNDDNQDEADQLLPQNTPFLILHDRVTPCTFYSVSLLVFVALLLITLFLTNLINYIQIVVIPLIAFTNFILPNVLAIGLYGWKAQKMSVALLVIVSIGTVTQFIFSVAELK